MSVQKVSYRYARSLMDVAIENKAVDNVLNDLNRITDMVNSNKELKRVFVSPVIPTYKKKAIFEEVFNGQVSELTKNFIILITEKNREELILEIQLEFTKLYNIKYNRQPVTIFSANELSEKLSSELVYKLTNMTGKTILPTFEVDKDIKGGVKIRIDDIIYDASLQSQLKMLHDRLTAN